MLHHASCLVCSSTRLTPLSGYERAHLCRCGACGFVFAQRIPTEQELNQFDKFLTATFGGTQPMASFERAMVKSYIMCKLAEQIAKIPG
jgi:transcription elongation factor Elf1